MVDEIFKSIKLSKEEENDLGKDGKKYIKAFIKVIIHQHLYLFFCETFMFGHSQSSYIYMIQKFYL